MLKTFGGSNFRNEDVCWVELGESHEYNTWGTELPNSALKHDRQETNVKVCVQARDLAEKDFYEVPAVQLDDLVLIGIQLFGDVQNHSSFKDEGTRSIGYVDIVRKKFNTDRAVVNEV